ncbi:MAG: alpha-amylase/4-alpha-glucanotransferase domain-containing protein [bacterium]
MSVVNFAFCVHNHQPVGSSDGLLEEMYQGAYAPFLDLLRKFPEVRVNLHYSGVILEWIARRHPEFISKLQELVKSGQVEMLTGGCYEPILPLLYDRDKVGQIDRLTKCVQKLTGYRAKGMWLSGGAWEPHLAKPIGDAGVEYILLDEFHFERAGLIGGNIFGYYITEEQGREVKVFPLSRRLRELIPFQPPEHTIEYLASASTEDGRNISVMAEDGEKFGSWPGTYKSIYEEEWLEHFFKLLVDNSSLIKAVTLSEYIASHKPLGKIYLPAAFLDEAMGWMLPADVRGKFLDALQKMDESIKPFLGVGFWRNFLVKYPESNNMYRKMCYVSDKVERIRKSKSKAQAELWQGQCNHSYWHGPSGGLYLPRIRFATYNHLIEAEKIVDRELHKEKKYWAETSCFDFDQDGYDEILVDCDSLNAYIDPAMGGTIFELDYKASSVNLMNAMTRREEDFHRRFLNAAATGREDQERHLKYDRYRRVSLVDHFLHPDTSIERFRNSEYQEQGDFVEGFYEAKVRKAKGKVSIALSRDGRVWVGDDRVPVRVRKVVNLSERVPTVDIEYSIRNLGGYEVSLWFGTEFNYSLLAGEGEERYYYIDGVELVDKRPVSVGSTGDVSRMGFVDEELGVNVLLAFSEPAVVWRFPIEAVLPLDSGFKRIYQSSVIFPHWKINLPGGKAWEFTISTTIRRTQA